MKYIEITNLEKYQHYKSGRNTVWVKWYYKCLDDYRFQQLTDAERWYFVGLIMLACRESNRVAYDPLYVYRRVAMSQPKGSQMVDRGLKKMAKLGLITIKNAINTIERRERKKDISIKNEKDDENPSLKQLREVYGKRPTKT